MEKKNSQHLSNFWFGFVLGGMAILGLGYFFGTKEGRHLLKEALVFFENFEENLESLLKEFEKEEDRSTSKKDNSSPPLLSSLTEKLKGLANNL